MGQANAYFQFVIKEHAIILSFSRQLWKEMLLKLVN